MINRGEMNRMEAKRTYRRATRAAGSDVLEKFALIRQFRAAWETAARKLCAKLLYAVDEEAEYVF